MCIWARISNVPVLAFLLPKDKDNNPQLIGFHLSIPMGHIESAPLFGAATEMVKYWVINSIHAYGLSPENPL